MRGGIPDAPNEAGRTTRLIVGRCISERVFSTQPRAQHPRHPLRPASPPAASGSLRRLVCGQAVGNLGATVRASPQLRVGSGAMLHSFGAKDSTVASGPLQLLARGAPLRGNVELLQLGPLIPPTRHPGASWKIRNGCSRCSVAWLCRALDVERVRQQRLMTRLVVSRNERLAATQLQQALCCANALLASVSARRKRSVWSSPTCSTMASRSSLAAPEMRCTVARPNPCA